MQKWTVATENKNKNFYLQIYDGLQELYHVSKNT